MAGYELRLSMPEVLSAFAQVFLNHHHFFVTYVTLLDDLVHEPTRPPGADSSTQLGNGFGVKREGNFFPVMIAFGHSVTP